MPELIKITPRPCEVGVCTKAAHYQSDGTAVCDEEMVNMSWLNEDNKEFFREALEKLAELSAN